MVRPTFAGIDSVLTRQALIVGQVTDGLTGRATHQPPTVALAYQTPPGEPARAYPLTARMGAGGLFVFAGDPATAFPRLSAGGSLALRLMVSAPGYQTQAIEFTLTDADLAFVERTLEVGDASLTVSVLDAPLVDETVALLPEPVHLGGRVVSAETPDVPVAGAQVAVTAPEARGPVSTGAEGFFTLQDVPVAQEVTVEVSGAAGFEDLVSTIHLDYRQPVNHVTFALSPS